MADYEQAGVQSGYSVGPVGRTWYEVHSTTQGVGVPVVVLHGGPGAPHDYLKPLAALSQDRPVVFYDQLGCGRSDRPAGFTGSVRHFVAELHQLRAELGLGQMHLLGQSWGTMLAVSYLLEHGTAGVHRLVLSGPYLSTAAFMADQRRHLAGIEPEDQQAITRCEQVGDYQDPAYTEAMARFYQRHVCRLQPWPDCLNDTMAGLGEAVYNGMWGPSEFTMTGSLRQADVTSELAQISIPVLLTCGEFDEVTPQTTASYAALLPDAEMQVFPECSHNHHLEAPEAYLQLVAGFLAGR